MLTSGIRFLPPRTFGQRTIIPLVRESGFSHDRGSLVMVNPLALIVEEEGNWNFFALEDGITPAILDTVITAGDPGGGSAAHSRQCRAAEPGRRRNLYQ